MPNLYLSGDPVADQLLSTDPNALLIGMLLDQQVPMEKAFSGPAVIASRMGGRLDVQAIAAADSEEFIALCSEPPAIHRFPRAMAERVQALCQDLVENWDGHASTLFATARTGEELRRLLAALPGFGAAKAQIFVALLGKQYGITPDGWREAAGEFGPDGYRSVADITDRESLLKVRATKQAVKAAAKAAKSG